MADEHLLTLQPGTVIAGRYEVVKCLGAGSMGLVYACRHRELSGHLVAVKVLFPEVSQDRIAAARFRNEIFASYGVSHPNVVRAYEYIRDGDLVAYTMEYVGGGDLADRLGRSKDPLSIGDIIKILSQMCAGVQAIHDAGIVHRDLKPENILLTRDGDVKIADFGIARTGHGPKLTEHGGVVGTIDYVSPEYMLNSQVDWRSDIYAIGILGYEMLTGESPFRGDSVYATMTKRLKTDPEPPSRQRGDCPQELDYIISRAMQRDPEARYQSTAEMFNDLQALATRCGLGIVMYGNPIEVPVERGEGSSREAPPAPKRQSDLIPTDFNLPRSGSAASSSQKTQNWEDENQIGYEPAEKQDDIFSRPIKNDKEGGRLSDQLALSAKKTAVFSPELFTETALYDRSLINAAQQYSTTLETSKERPKPPSRKSETEDTRVFSTAIDTDRMRKLHELVDQEPQWDLFDFVRLTLAILIGLGVGFIVVKQFLPNITGTSSEYVEVETVRGGR